jgi:hypothetical protein
MVRSPFGRLPPYPATELSPEFSDVLITIVRAGGLKQPGGRIALPR